MKKLLPLHIFLLIFSTTSNATFTTFRNCMNNAASTASSIGVSYGYNLTGTDPQGLRIFYCDANTPPNCWNTGTTCWLLADNDEGKIHGPPPPTRSEGICSIGSNISDQARSVGETIPIVGTPFSLVYSSARGRRTYEYTSRTPICQTASAGGSLPDCQVDITVAGTTYSQSYIGGVLPAHVFVWNGLNSSSQPMYFAQTMAQTYTLLNLSSPDSGWFYPIVSARLIGTYDSMLYGLGGWGVDVLHAIGNDIIYYGDGSSEHLEGGGQGFVKSPSRDEFYKFDSDGRLLETRSGLLGDVIYSFSYDSNGHLTAITDAYGNVTTFNRSSGVITGITSPYSMTTSVGLNSDGFLYTVTDPNSKVTTVTYSDSRGLIASFAQPGAAATTFSHTSDGLLITDSNPTGRSLTYSYDSATPPNVTETSALGIANFYSTPDPDNYATQSFYGYTASGNSVSVAAGFNSTYVATSDGSTTTTYGDDGRNLDDPLSPASRRQFKQLYSVQFNTPGYTANRTEHYYNHYNLSDPHDMFSVTFANWQFWLGSSSTSFDSSYDASTTKYTYTSRLSRTSYRTIDSHERTTQIAIPHLDTIDLTYDSNGRLYTVTQGSRSLTYVYDSHGFLSSLTDALSHTTGYTYNNSGFLTGITLPDTRAISMTHDDRGNITSVTDPKSHTTSFSWNGFDRQTQFYPPLLTGISTPQTDITYTTDQDVDTITRPDSQVIDYDYSSSTGLLNSMATPQGTTTISMDYANRLSSATLGYNTTQIVRDGPYIKQDKITQLNAAGTSTEMAMTEYTYNSGVGNRSSITVRDSSSSSVLSASLGYDDDYLLTTAGDETLGYNSDNGLLESIDNGNVHVTITHNSNGDVDTYTAKYNTTTLYTYTLTYYDDGRIHTMNETIQGTSNNYSYTYDAAGRLSTVTKNSTLISSYTYDNNGNRTSGTKNGVSFSATFDAQDRLSTWNTYSFGYNDNGETISRTNSSTSVTTNYSYDVFGHMMEASVTGAMDVVYNIDPTGRRIKRTSSGTETARYLYDGQHRVVGEVDSSNVMRRLFVYASRENIPDYYNDGTDDFQYFVDPLGSVRLLVNVATGTVALRRDYDEFGIITNSSGTNDQPLGFAGGVYDAETNFYHFGEREYDPETGRWLSKDPIGFGGGDTNLYGYAIQDPINFLDPSGLSSIDFDRGSGTITVKDGNGNVVGTFPAGNNTAPGSGGPWPNGTYPYSHHVPHPESGPNGQYGSNGNFVFTVPGRSGMGVHSGRSGPNSSTLGCVRTNDDATRFIRDLIRTDPLTSITIHD